MSVGRLEPQAVTGALRGSTPVTALSQPDDTGHAQPTPPPPSSERPPVIPRNTHYQRPDGNAAPRWQDMAECGPDRRQRWGLHTLAELDALFEVAPQVRRVPPRLAIICGACSVRQQCLDEALLEQQANGIAIAMARAGLTPAQIRREAKRNQRAHANDQHSTSPTSIDRHLHSELMRNE